MTLDFMSLEKDVESIDSPPPVADPVDINSKDGKITIIYSNGVLFVIFYNTALLYAVTQGYSPIVDSLLNIEGINVNLKNNHFKKNCFLLIRCFF